MANVTTNSAVAIILLGGQGVQSIDIETDDVDYMCITEIIVCMMMLSRLIQVAYPTSR